MKAHIITVGILLGIVLFILLSVVTHGWLPIVVMGLIAAALIYASIWGLVDEYIEDNKRYKNGR